MSGRKSNLNSFHNITDGDMSQATITSVVTNIEQLDNIGFQLNWAGTAPVGTIAIQVSLDYQQDTLGNVTNAGTWATIGMSPTPSVSGDTGSAYIDLNQLSAPWIRAVYTKTSGIGTLNGWVTGKMI